jgi:hypothetical protein
VFQDLPIPGGGGSLAFIVRSGLAVVYAANETYAFDPVPVGTFGVHATRSTQNADGSVSTKSVTASPVVVTSGKTTAANLAF